MNISKAIAAAIWILSIVHYSVYRFPDKLLQGFDLSGDYWLLLAQVLLAALFASKINGYPFQVPSLAAKIDARYGPGTYANFIADVKPLLLFGISGLVCGCSHLFRHYQQQDGAALFPAAAMFSWGIAFLVCRVILQKRGLLMEVRDDARRTPVP
jgi:hypothetical protein